jgi:hypothetical protein
MATRESTIFTAKKGWAAIFPEGEAIYVAEGGAPKRAIAHYISPEQVEALRSANKKQASALYTQFLTQQPYDKAGGTVMGRVEGETRVFLLDGVHTQDPPFPVPIVAPVPTAESTGRETTPQNAALDDLAKALRTGAGSRRNGVSKRG